MNIKLPYIAWRDGRPRFEPGPGMRRHGFVGRDLKHDDGRWFSLDEAERYAVAQRDHFRRARGRSGNGSSIVHVRKPKPETIGFVYFLRSGDHIKIGFSKDPRRRAENLSVGLPRGISVLAYVPGSRDDEARLHHALQAHRLNGEWFRATDEVVGALARSVSAGAPMLKDD